MSVLMITKFVLP